MKKTAVVSLIILALMAPALVSVPPVSAKTLKFNEILNPPYWTYPDDYSPGMPGIQPQDRPSDWVGKLTGDISAKCYFWETDKNFVTGAGVNGKVEHFFEDLLIVFPDGGWLVGHEKQGIFTFKDFKYDSAKYHAEGPITSASPDKQNFIGCKFFEEGIVTFPDWTGVGRGYIGP